MGGTSELTLWETAPPPGGDEARRIVKQAREIVDQRLAEDRFAYAVIEWLLAARTLAEPVREAAIQITRARRDPALHAIVGERMRELFLPSAVVDSLRGDESLPDRARTIAIEIALGIPDDFDAYVARGDFYFYAGRDQWHEAIADYTEAIRTGPQNVRPYRKRGESYVQLKEYAKAAADYERCAELLKAGSFPTFEYSKLAWLYAHGPPEIRDAGKAIPLYERAIELEPDNAIRPNNLAWFYVTGPPEIRDAGKAIPLAERAVELDPGNAGWLNTLGVVYYRNGQFEECVETLNQAVEMTNGGTAFDFFFLAMSHHRLARTAKAREAFDQAVKWWEARKPLSSAWEEELTAFRAEANKLLFGQGQPDKP